MGISTTKRVDVLPPLDELVEDADAVEVGVEALAHARHVLGRDVDRVGVEPRQHPLDGVLGQLRRVDALDVGPRDVLVGLLDLAELLDLVGGGDGVLDLDADEDPGGQEAGAEQGGKTGAEHESVEWGRAERRGRGVGAARDGGPGKIEANPDTGAAASRQLATADARGLVRPGRERPPVGRGRERRNKSEPQNAVPRPPTAALHVCHPERSRRISGATIPLT